MTPSEAGWRRTSILAIAGGSAFWLANFIISLTPIAADYRAALAIDYVPMLVAALFGGLSVGFGVSYVLVRFQERIPTKGCITKSVLLSFIALVAATVLLEVPARFFPATSDSWRLFLTGLLFNLVRILALGVAVGYLYARLNVQRPVEAAA
jgi:hypothetical protein